MINYNDKAWTTRRKVIKNEKTTELQYLIETPGTHLIICSVEYLPEENTTLYIQDNTYYYLTNMLTLHQRRAIYQAIHQFTEDIEKLIVQYNCKKEFGMKIY